MSTTPTSIMQQLKRDEGTRLSVYLDSRGYSTIGIGTCIDARKGCALTEAEAEYLCQNRIDWARATLLVEWPWMQALADSEPIRFAVVNTMAFIMGVHGVSEFHDFLSALQSADYETASQQMIASDWYKEEPSRVQRLSVQMSTGVWQ